MNSQPQMQNVVHTYCKALEGKNNVTALLDANREIIQRFMPSQFQALYIYNLNKKLLKYWDTPVNINQVLGEIYSLDIFTG